eukprot:CAMPEP_0175049698 /NCGR_PEP_ID=MMETSP0052_2-20121109/6866_1 /TAXON_ID=51329 ORGANISM="Polytomella parva, Strain SAG 63-3" /NCGR_SAMPLE_ID=MMETSP0052_2 /ASSEMBLY_ACC=CAM_ASM_000194 /LENGTH=992 /DNA_ID=CAMNT_0016313855 /DNA_START=123 /DNA_END=3098 /DNA_ORIENTATION=+
MTAAVSSASGLLALLEEPSDEVKYFALQKLETVVKDFWFEIAGSIAQVEALYEDDAFKHRELAALVASKVFYHLGELDDALTYALNSGSMFNVDEKSEYVDTLIARGLDKYFELRVKLIDKSEEVEIDERLSRVTEVMLNKCISAGQYEQAVGICLESRRLDKLEEVISSVDSVSRAPLLQCSLRTCQVTISNKQFRQQALRLLIKLFEGVEDPDLTEICQILMILNDSASVSRILARLLNGSKDDYLLAYQICFDLSDNENQVFLDRVIAELRVISTAAAVAAAGDVSASSSSSSSLKKDEEADVEVTDAVVKEENEGEEEEGVVVEGIDIEVNEDGDEAKNDKKSKKAKKSKVDDTNSNSNSANESETRANTPSTSTSTSIPPPTSSSSSSSAPPTLVRPEQFTKAEDILSGRTPMGISLEFMYGNNRSDLEILNELKNSTDARVSVLHGAVVAANAFLHAGTTVDVFLRENLDWLSRSINWSKFSATASVGVIHKGHLQQGLALLEPYLPNNNSSSVTRSAYSEGGAMFALGLIFANHGNRAIYEQLFSGLDLGDSENEYVASHGACLGLGLVALGTDDDSCISHLKASLYHESAVVGEAAGMALGLVGAGCGGGDYVKEMLEYAHDTPHEKVVRGVGLGVALCFYGLEEKADAIIDQMTQDQDPTIRYGGMYAIGMAYRGTDNNNAVQKLLHFAVSDVNDNVRRAAVLCVGFVLAGSPDLVVKAVALLTESFNLHVRYGAAMAIGIGCAGSGSKEALALLEPMLSDRNDLVLQGVLVATALVLIQQPETKLAPFRRVLDRIIHDRHEDVMYRMGAILATGIIDAGGRNATISLKTRSGMFRLTSFIGLAVFTQYWYWYPLIYFLSLALHPTALIAVNENFQMPKVSLNCACKPSMFATAPPLAETPAKDHKQKFAAILSATLKAKERARKKEARKQAKAKAEAAAAAAAAAAATAAATTAAAGKEGKVGEGEGAVKVVDANVEKKEEE